jgi:hypothetical protein
VAASLKVKPQLQAEGRVAASLELPDGYGLKSKGQGGEDHEYRDQGHCPRISTHRCLRCAG